jgi:hypothetical protein
VDPACIYSMDDTTLWLDIKMGASVTALQTTENIKLSKELNIGISVRHKEEEVPTACKSVKIFALTGGAGQVPCRVIKITDKAFTFSELVRVQKNADGSTIWVHLIPGEAAEDDERTKTERNVANVAAYMETCILPAILADRERLKSCKPGPVVVDENGDSQPTSWFTGGLAGLFNWRRERGKRFDRAILTFDGDFPQLRAFIDMAKSSDWGNTLAQNNCRQGHRVVQVGRRLQWHHAAVRPWSKFLLFEGGNQKHFPQNSLCGSFQDGQHSRMGKGVQRMAAG